MALTKGCSSADEQQARQQAPWQWHHDDDLVPGHERGQLHDAEGDKQEHKARRRDVVERGDGVELDAPVMEQDLDEAEPEGLGQDGAALDEGTH